MSDCDGETDETEQAPLSAERLAEIRQVIDGVLYGPRDYATIPEQMTVDLLAEVDHLTTALADAEARDADADARIHALAEQARGLNVRWYLAARQAEAAEHKLAAALEIVRAVADADNSDDVGCYQLCDIRDLPYRGADEKFHEHVGPCRFEQARALLAEAAYGEQSEVSDR